VRYRFRTSPRAEAADGRRQRENAEQLRVPVRQDQPDAEQPDETECERPLIEAERASQQPHAEMEMSESLADEPPWGVRVSFIGDGIPLDRYTDTIAKNCMQ